MTLKILLADDSKADVALFKRMLKDSGLDHKLTVVKDGQAALDFVYNEKEPRPDLVVLDLNMPKKKGIDVLAEIKSNDNLKVIPVVILTTSENPEHIHLSYHLHANAYVTKPVNLDKFREVIKHFSNWWGGTVALPPQEEG